MTMNFLNWKMYSVICQHLTWMSKFELKTTQKKKRSLPVPLLQSQQLSQDAQLVTLLMLPSVERWVTNIAIVWKKYFFLGNDHQWWRNGWNQNRRKERNWWGTKNPNLKAQIEKGSRSCRWKAQTKRLVHDRHNHFYKLFVAEREAAQKDGGDGADGDSSEEASETTELVPAERDEEVSSDEEGDEEQYWKKVQKKGKV